MTTCRIGVAQLPISADPRLNGTAVRRVMRAAAEQGARPVLLPEGRLTGYAKEQHTDWSRLDAKSWTPSRGSQRSSGCGWRSAPHTR